MPKRKRKAVAHKRKPIKKRTVKRKVKAKARPKPKTRKRKRAVVAKKRTARKRRVVRQVQRTSVVRVVTGKPKRKRPRKRKVVMAGKRRRTVGKKSSNMLIVVGLGALAVYLLTKPKAPTYPNYPNLPPLIPTNNYQRNDQASSVLNYALAAGLAMDAVTRLIDRLNQSSDSDLKNIYDHVQTTGDVGVYV